MSMRHVAFVGLLLLAASQVMSAPEKEPLSAVDCITLKRGESIPEPPAQNRPWEPPSTAVPPKVVSSTKTLFSQGFPDPRGCEYREIEVIVGDEKWMPVRLKTHGWVLPTSDQNKKLKRFAICWNGLVYPVLAVGEPARLQTDVEWMVKPREVDERQVSPEAMAVGGEVPRVPAVCLLLRLGEGELADKVWRPVRKKLGSFPPYEVYWSLTQSWGYSRFARLLAAHKRGDDALALLDARALTDFMKVFDKQIVKEGMSRRAPDPDQPFPYMESLGPLPVFLADQERRAKNPKLRPDLDALLKNRSPSRIHDMIEALDEISPGFHGPETIEKALIEEGDRVVDPLIDCIESDFRLTRGMPSNSVGDTEVVPVTMVAWRCLTTILKSEFRELYPRGGVYGQWSDTLTDGRDRKALVAALRKYWGPFKNLPIEERWYRTLADPQVPLTGLVEPLANIVMITNYKEIMEPFAVNGGFKPGAKIKRQGDALRPKNPGVTELVAQRIQTMNPTNDVWTAVRLTQNLVEWDDRAALPLLKWFCPVFDKWDRSAERHGSGVDLVRFYLVRARLGDQSALDEYGSWIQDVPRASEMDFQAGTIFEPIWRYPDHPAIRLATIKVFKAPDSPWRDLAVRLICSSTGQGYYWTPLITVEGFREMLLQELSNTTKAGSVRFEGGSYVMKYDPPWSQDRRAIMLTPYHKTDEINLNDLPLPKTGTLEPFRVCDLVASELFSYEGAPEFRLYWNEWRRDTALKACRDFLQRLGGRLTRSEGTIFGSFGPGYPVSLGFPKLGHPASADEAARGLAIFSLPQDKQRRVVPLPKIPTYARWTTRKTIRLKWPPYPNGKHPADAYEQGGQIWQAEEVLENGLWKRYYGFVGAGTVSAVPAEEIEFPSGWGDWSEFTGDPNYGLLTSHWDSQVEIVEEPPPKVIYVGQIPTFAPSTPIRIAIKVHNKSGLDETLPGEISPLGDAAKGALPPGVRLELAYSERDPSGTEGTDKPSKGKTSTKPAWKILAARAAQVGVPADSPRTVPAGQTIEVTALNLNDSFDLSRPGHYRLKVFFKGGEGKSVVSGQSNTFRFALGVQPTGQ